MKLLFNLLLPIFISTLATSSLHAQFKLKDIPLLSRSDFRAHVPYNARFPIYINIKTYYKIDTIIKKGDNNYQVFVKTKIEPLLDESYWDTQRIDMQDVGQLLMHEQGHLYLAYICGNNIEKVMPTIDFTANWKEEVRKKFFELLRDGQKSNIKYEEETAHGLNLKQQGKWTQWMKEELGD